MNTKIEDQVLQKLKGLPYESQWRVLEFTRALAELSPKGIPGRDLISFAGTIQSDDLIIMQKVIEEACEKVDANGW